MYCFPFGKEGEKSLILFVGLFYLLDDDVILALEAEEMHKHPLRRDLIVDGIEDVHAVDDHIFAGDCLLDAGFLDIGMPSRVGFDV